MALQLPQPPASGIVTDPGGLQWRAIGDGMWQSQSCPTCNYQLGPLTWPELLQRGPLTEVTA